MAEVLDLAHCAVTGLLCLCDEGRVEDTDCHMFENDDYGFCQHRRKGPVTIVRCGGG